jgi:hypothetical protein
VEQAEDVLTEYSVSVATPPSPTVTVVGGLATVVLVVMVAGGFRQLQAADRAAASVHLFRHNGLFPARFSLRVFAEPGCVHFEM